MVIMVLKSSSGDVVFAVGRGGGGGGRMKMIQLLPMAIGSLER